MNSIIGSIIIGIVVGLFDVIPMLIKKMDKRACLSAFLQYLVASFVILHADIPGISWWIEGSLISLLMAIPVIVIVSKTDNKAIPVITMNALALGTLISLAGHYFIQ